MFERDRDFEDEGLAIAQARIDSIRFRVAYVLASAPAPVVKGCYLRIVAVFRNGSLQRLADGRQLELRIAERRAAA